MREPYRTLFEGFETHWFLGPYVDEHLDEPDWYGIAADERLDGLSTGEKVLLDFAAAYANVRKYLDDALQYRVGLALQRSL
jgi:hypothetical protein